MSKKHDIDSEDEFFEPQEENALDMHEMDEEFEEPELIPVDEINRLNDINLSGEIDDVDISGIFLLSQLAPEHELWQKSTLDLNNLDKKDISLQKKHILKMVKLKRPITDLKNNKNYNDINLDDSVEFKPKDNILDLDKIENLNISPEPIFDIQKPKIKIRGKIIRILKNIYIFANQNLFKYFVIISSLILIVFMYWFLTKYKLLSTFDKIKTIEVSNNIDELNSQLSDFKLDFMILNILLKPIFLWNEFLNNEKITNLNYIISGWIKLSEFGLDWVKFYEGFSEILKNKWPDWIKYTQLLKNIDPLLVEMINNLNSWIKLLSQIKDLQNDELNQKYFEKLSQLKKVQSYINNLYYNKDKIDSILWDKQAKVYLVVFQNNDEIRPTWGFMWSMMFVTIYKWKVINLEKKDIYALEYLLKPYKLRELSPEWINKLSQYFGLRDSNYYIDLAQSSEKIKYFLDKTDYKVDWIVYINQNLIVDFLKKYWEINYPAIKTPINWDNFSMVTSTLVEAKVSKTSDVMSTPKQVLFDFIDFYIKQIKQNWDYLWYIKIALNSIEKKDVMFYSFNREDDNFLKQIWLKKDLDFWEFIDYNYPVFTSISWNKSDRYMKRTFQKYVKVNVDCSISTKFKIIQEHTFGYKEEQSIKNFLYSMDLLWKIDLDYSLKIQWNQKNRQFVRVLLPKNAVLKQKPWMQIYDVDKFWEVWFYLDTELYSKSDYTIEYTIPNPECKNYNYKLEKQSWLKNYKVDYYKNNVLQQTTNTDYDYIVK